MTFSIRQTKFGQWYSKIGRIEQLLATPCNPSPWAWAKATWFAVPHMLISPIKPSQTDYLIKRRGVSHGIGRKWSFDVWDVLQGNNIGKPWEGWWGFELGANWGARILWYTSLADAGLDGAINWMSLAYQYAGCDFPGHQWCNLKALPGLYPTFIFDDGNFDGWAVDTQSGFSGGPTGIAIPAHSSAGVGFTLDWNTDGIPQDQAASGDFQLRLVAATKDIRSAAPNVLLASGNNHAAFYSIQPGGKEPFAFYSAQWKGSAGLINVVSGNMNADGGAFWGAGFHADP